MNIKATKQPDTSGLVGDLTPALVEAGQALIAQMHMRTSRGIGLNDAEMPAYSPDYAKQKKKAGRSAQPRNLTNSGSMLRSIHLVSTSVEGTSATITIGFSNANDARKAAYNQAIAPWFGASPKDVEIVTRLFRDRVAKLLKAKGQP
jgi:hypothetical protein